MDTFIEKAKEDAAKNDAIRNETDEKTTEAHADGGSLLRTKCSRRKTKMKIREERSRQEGNTETAENTTFGNNSSPLVNALCSPPSLQEIIPMWTSSYD
ncbi:hypothetical protein RvY_01689 [Ramazzottius varieornatus]|uniref:Uncharacterized protein n=1 Tax=Ramazzottius varieornatus TaxID=947166 RepID=A0A1D1UL13_RAMVA|nr:hypothetical protein RvY_01689 [Ramazzottius varieornatus]